MKLGLISDIHGDFESLRAALDLLQREGAERILCLGDVVEKGPDGDAVVQTLRQRRIPCVLGNHDEATPGNQRWLRENADLDHPAVRGRLLGDDSVAYLEGLPFSLRFAWKDKQGTRLRVLLVHGTPASNVDYLFANSQPAKFERIAQLADADVILFGHTHEPVQARFAGVRFFNPGSVRRGDHPGKAYRQGGYKIYDSHTCATLTLPDLDFRVWAIGTSAEIDAPVIP